MDVSQVIPKEEPEKVDGLNRTRREGENESREIEVRTSNPPINITELTPETEYSFVITTVLNPKFRTTFVVENVHTTANNSQLPEEIVGNPVYSLVRMIVPEFFYARDEAGPGAIFQLIEHRCGVFVFTHRVFSRW